MTIYFIYDNIIIYKEDQVMANKKKTIHVGTISGLDLLKKSREPEYVPFRTGAYKDKRKKREKVNKRNYNKYL